MARHIRRRKGIFVSSRTDPSFSELMDQQSNLHKVLSIQHLILSHPYSPSLSLDFLNRLSPKLHLDSFATPFLTRFPHFFTISPHPFCTLTPTALQLSYQEHNTIMASLPLPANRLTRLLAISVTKSLPLKAVSILYRELGLPRDFEHSVISKNPHLFTLHEEELRLVGKGGVGLVAAVEDWRMIKCAAGECDVDMRYSFSQGFPPGTSFKKERLASQEGWQRLAYVGPYDQMPGKAGVREMEKRAVAVCHEFLSVTVEKMAEVEKMRLFSKWFGIDFDILDLFLDHPGIFYVSRKVDSPRTVFLKEAYEKGRLIQPDPVYEVRRKMLDLIVLGQNGIG